MLVTALKLADDKLYFGAAGLFDEVPALLEKTKIASAIDEKSGKIRFAVKLKSAETAKLTVVYRIVGESAAPGQFLTAPATKSAPAVQVSAPAAPEPAVPVSSDSLVGDTEAEDNSFYIENPPAAIHCGWKYTLRVHDTAGTKGTVHWENGEEGAGMIDQNGQYTAPAKPGAYEVIARLLPENTEAAGAMADEPLEASVYLIVL